MAGKKISDLVEDTSLTDDYELVVQRPSAGSTRKSSLLNVLKNLFTFKDVYDDYLVSGFSVELGTGNAKPTFANYRGGIYLYSFNSTGIDEAFFVIHLKHDFKSGQSPTFHVHWSHNSPTATGDVKWGIEYSVARGYGAGTFSATSTAYTIQTADIQYTHHITNDDDITIPSSVELEPDSVIIGRIFRNGDDVEDTFTAPAFLLQVDLHYIKSRTGTTERNRPYTSGGF